MTEKQLPRPGSDEAYDKGCTCPVFINNRGGYPPIPPRGSGWFINPTCPLHGNWRSAHA